MIQRVIRKRNDGRGASDELRQQVAELRQQVADLRAEISAQHDAQIAQAQDLFNRTTVRLEDLASSHAQLLAAAQVSADEPRATRATLRALRGTPDYEAAYADPDPLVSIVMPTYTNAEGLRERSIPSALAQTHANIEVIVVGDVSPPEVADAVASFDDARLRFENLTQRGPYPEKPRDFWYTAGTYPINRAMELSRGQWIAVLNDDDAFRPDFVASLLAHARETRAEVAYGKLRHHEPEKDDWDLGVFPPENHAFGWQMALQHGALRAFEYELWAPTFDEPGDWNRAGRMLRAGVQFSMLDHVVADYWPSTLWKGRRT